jgi:RNA polymerase sigma-70 factor (ECF subfamily)
LDYSKKKKSLPFSTFINEEGFNKLEEIEDEDISADDLVISENNEAEFRHQVENIPELYRNILIMRYRDNLSLLEISEILGISYNTVKSRHNRGLRVLRDKLKVY